MKILSIETSCDETAVSIVETTGEFPHAEYRIRGNALISQAVLHAEYGGVFPTLAKREHAKALAPLIKMALEEAGMLQEECRELDIQTETSISEILHREPELASALLEMARTTTRPAIDLIAVTSGPGLEPALWVGVNGARALAGLWDVPITAVNHLEGHILSALLHKKSPETDFFNLASLSFPALALSVAGGHTELVRIDNWGSYETIGHTLDDAVGEAFDKVARMLDLPYPGGPEISRLATQARAEDVEPTTGLPRPMRTSPDYNVSFSGLKTAVLYALRDREKTNGIDEAYKKEIALDFENAVTDVLLTKVKKAIDEYGIKTLIISGGVSANAHLRETFRAYADEAKRGLTLYLPNDDLTTDNAIMIALAGHAHHTEHTDPAALRAAGNLPLAAV